MTAFGRMRAALVDRVLGLHDTPQRIAWGVFLGTVVAWTPTLGFQILIYVAVATLLRANKLSGIPILFLTNPLTAVPLYWFCWKVGAAVLGSDAEVDATAFEERLNESSAQVEQTSLWTDIWTAEFWRDIGSILLELGVELWTGSFIVGFAMGLPLYFLTLWAVRVYRRARGPQH